MEISNPVYKELAKYMNKFGLANKISNQKLLNSFKSKTKNGNEFSEKRAIESIKDYLKQCISDSTISIISSNIYEKFVDYDDENVIKIIRKLFIIYIRCIKKAKLRYFLNYKLRCSLNNKLLPQQTSNFVYTKKVNPISKVNNIQIRKEEEKNNSSISSLPLRKIDYVELDKSKIKKQNQSFTSPSTHRRKISKEQQSELFLHLYNDSKTRKEKIRKLSLEKEKKFNSIYTFTPIIISKNISTSVTEGNFIDRLSNYEKQKNQKIRQIKKEIETNTPKPKIPNKKISIAQSHLIPTSKNFQLQKKEKIEKIKNEMLQEQGVTFKPILNENVNCNVKGGIIERNENFIKSKEAKLNYFSKCEDHECTFKPKINDKMVPVIEDNLKVGDRLFHYQSKYKQNLEERKTQYEKETTYPFHPKISKNTKEILENKKKMMEEIKKRYSNSNTNSNVNYKTNTNSEIVTNADIKEEGSSNKKINELSEEEINSLGNYEETNNKTKSNAKKEITPIPIQSMNDEKLIEMAKNYLSVDESLDKFQFKYKKKLGKENFNTFGKEKETTENNNKEKDNIKQNSHISSSTKKNLMNNLDYYDNL